MKRPTGWRRKGIRQSATRLGPRMDVWPGSRRSSYASDLRSSGRLQKRAGLEAGLPVVKGLCQRVMQACTPVEEAEAQEVDVDEEQRSLERHADESSLCYPTGG